jgi:hypothetical protein
MVYRARGRVDLDGASIFTRAWEPEIFIARMVAVGIGFSIATIASERRS